MIVLKDQLLNLTLPKKYKENLIQYTPGLDNVPEWIDLPGYTKEQYKKLTILVSIEDMKYTLDEAMKDNEITQDEIELTKQMIDARIKEYNEL
ncbi:hypothetical protein KM914_14230 [Virgibacillus pantothenticus]|uniref:hypothetical protein n=1 Tax=Virgibacillus pantothenticus TaxID=1473 RepID=UPI001C24EBD8|nr:hypothetical protein [Virgibacillus pantothenticus]MBU8567577.1 hypothetical protein [Virgibacillus pantothenticus]MBU8643702.1 hypothetical protein [Virgibacillus pantothenticus]MBU8670027.1 hypothetical protein [Virgibacillus pantothenticus]MBU8673928.1 hypothetical protein [Virgibacillus pantothenticus]MBU8705411.1 hypothetical protein [Virgibacillus pantothenticus]